MKRISENVKTHGLAVIFAVVVGFVATGCVAGSYSGAYYAPDYGPYYGDYGYSGGPYYGYEPGYIGGFSISSGHRYQRYYGGHHFSHEEVRNRGGFSRAGHAGGNAWHPSSGGHGGGRRP